jgi:hypothetical protein
MASGEVCYEYYGLRKVRDYLMFLEGLKQMMDKSWDGFRMGRLCPELN